MAINLQEIRTAFQTYVDTKVSVSISALAPAVPGTINPDEEFTFSVTVTNASTASGGISLVNVRYHIHVANPSVAKLIVPPVATATTRSGPTTAFPTLSPGTQVSEMFLFPISDTLGAGGDSDTISGLKGKSGGAVGTTSIRFDIHADPDLSFLFPTNEISAQASRTLNIV